MSKEIVIKTLLRKNNACGEFNRQLYGYYLISFQAAGLSQSIDPILAEKIHSYTNEGVHNVREMKRLLKLANKNDLFQDL